MKTVVITGASSGIGLDLAKASAKNGANVILLARNQERLDRAVSVCKSLLGHSDDKSIQKILAFSVDVTDKVQLASCVDNIKSQVSSPDYLYLCAGVVTSVRFSDQSDQDFEQLLNTNVIGTRTVIKAFLPDMIAERRGHICIIGSLAGLIPAYGYSAYNTSKFALMGMAGAMRQELAEYNVGVSIACPPEVDTPMVAQEAKHILPQTRAAKDLGGTLNVETVTKSILKGIAKNRFLIIPGTMAKFSYSCARLFPRTFTAILQFLVKKTAK